MDKDMKIKCAQQTYDLIILLIIQKMIFKQINIETNANLNIILLNKLFIFVFYLQLMPKISHENSLCIYSINFYWRG
jgi:hypothetical protein